MWEVEYTTEFEDCWDALSPSQQESVAAVVRMLESLGPRLPFPWSSGVRGSRHSTMRELRVQSGGDPLRVLYSFDPRRVAVLLIGGSKRGSARWYDRMIPKADRILDRHLEHLGRKD